METEKITSCIATRAIIDELCRFADAGLVLAASVTDFLIDGITVSVRILELCRMSFDLTVLFQSVLECGIIVSRVISKRTAIGLVTGCLYQLPHTEMKVINDDGRILPLRSICL